MRITNRFLGALALATSVALMATGCTGGTASPAPAGGSGSADAPLETIDVNFGYIGDFNGTSLLAVAEDQGIWAKHGLAVNPVVFTNGPLQIQAMGTGDLDFGYIGPGAVWLPASGKATMVMINSLGQADRVIAQPGITKIEDLKGKNVAVPEGTSGDMILTLALEEAGMTKSDVTVIPMDPAAVVTAFGSGQVDAAGLWYPAIGTLKKQVPDLVELAQNSDFEDQMAFPSSFVAGPDVIEKNPEMAERVVAALKEANQWRYDNTDETIELVAKFLALDVETVKADAANVKLMSTEELETLSTDGTAETWLAAMNDYFTDSGKLDATALEPSAYYDSALFTGAGK